MDYHRLYFTLHRLFTSSHAKHKLVEGSLAEEVLLHWSDPVHPSKCSRATSVPTPATTLRQWHHQGRTAGRPAHLDHNELALHGLPRAAPQLLLVNILKSAMLVVDTLLQNYEDGGVLGLSDSIAKAIAGCAARLREFSCLHGEMLGKKRG